MRRYAWLLSVPVLGAVVIVAAAQAPAPCPHPLDGRTIVLVANGVGGAATFSENLRDAAAEARSGLVIRTVVWSRYNSVVRDYADQEGQLAAAARLASSVQELRSQCPHSHFVLVGYSAGSRIVLAAAEQLPAGSLDRVVVLAATVSCNYDLQRALHATCGGIDVFYSPEDGVLAQAEMAWPTSDGQKSPTAGRVGFRDPCPGKDCGGVYANVHQYRWTPEFKGQGSHSYWTRPFFLRRSLVPLLMTACAPATATVDTKEPPLAK